MPPPPHLVAAGQHASGGALDEKRVALYLAQEWNDSVAHTCGLGWFIWGANELWNHDPLWSGPLGSDRQVEMI